MFLNFFIFIFWAICLQIKLSSQTTIDVVINADQPIGDLRTLWTSTGFSPEEARSHDKNVSAILSRMDTFLNLKLIGSLPIGAMQQVRVHWLLDLMEGPFKIGSRLDSFVHLLWSNNLRPGFEIMGNPGQFFQSNFTDRGELDLWTKSIKFMINHFVQKYGINYVSQWNFESWNEPDHHIHNPFGGNNITYRNYLEATWNALNSFENLRFGGPGGSCRQPNFINLCSTFLQFCKDKLNGSTKSSILKFISFHRKGQGEVDSILNDEVEKTVPFIEETLDAETVAKNNISIFNDEGDPQKSWWKPQFWRATVAYPALVARHMALTQKEQRIKIDSISNDNAFLNTFDDIPSPFMQRTLFTRLGDPVNDPIMIPKPIFHLWTLFSLQGTDELRTEIIDLPGELTIIASRTKYSMSILLSSISNTSNSEEFRFKIKNFHSEQEETEEEMRYRVYSLEDSFTNPQKAWFNAGKPWINVNPRQIRKIRQASKLHQSDITAPIFNSHSEQEILLKLNGVPCVKLIHICLAEQHNEVEDIYAPLQRLNQPYDIRFHAEEMTGNLIIMWKYPEKPFCLKGFLIQFSKSGRFDDFETIVFDTKSINNFYILPKTAQGWYRIRALDFFDLGIVGPYSVPKLFQH